jgi:superfamily I DNA and/or RNA helicase
MKKYVTKMEKEFFMNCLTIGIRKLGNDDFKEFVRIFKTLEWLIVEKLPIIVTTCKAAKSNIFNKIHFSQVIIDEAT